MDLANWFVGNVSRIQEAKKGKIKQFAIEPLKLKKSWKCFEKSIIKMQSLGIWGMQNFNSIFESIEEKKEFIVLIGFRPSRFHLGHVTLAKEVAWYSSFPCRLFFVVSNYGLSRFPRNEIESFVIKFLKNLKTYSKNVSLSPEIIFSDAENLEIRRIEDTISKTVSMNKIFQLYGWDRNIVISKIRESLINVATFFYPQTLFASVPVLVPLDVNQITHVEVARIASRALNLEMPAFSYRSLLQSRRSPLKRMSVKDNSSVIFLDEEKKVLRAKLIKSFSGGGSKNETSSIGNNPFVCSFFHYAQLLLSYNEAERVLSNCLHGGMCKNCKELYSSLLVDKILSFNLDK